MEIKTIASGSSGNCYLVQFTKVKLLLECGISFKRIQEGVGFCTSDIDSVLLTHEHMDHAKGVKSCIKRGLDIYTSAGTAEVLNISGHRVKTVKSGREFEIKSLEIIPFLVEHDAKEPLGFIIWDKLANEKLLFFTDTASLPYAFDPVDYILGECNYSKDLLKNGGYSESTKKRIIKTHMEFKALINVLGGMDLSKLKRLYLCHLSAYNSDAQFFKTAISERFEIDVEIAKGEKDERRNKESNRVNA